MSTRAEKRDWVDHLSAYTLGVYVGMLMVTKVIFIVFLFALLTNNKMLLYIKKEVVLKLDVSEQL